MIRTLQKDDIERVMQIWLSGNKEAHSFVPGDYWTSNYEMVKEQLPKSDVFVFEADNEVQGFIGLADTYIAGIFVDKKRRSMGVGRQLLAYVKERYETLTLNVYCRNRRAVEFYLREGFLVSAEETDEATGCTEYTMIWTAEKAGVD